MRWVCLLIALLMAGCQSGGGATGGAVTAPEVVPAGAEAARAAEAMFAALQRGAEVPEEEEAEPTPPVERRTGVVAAPVREAEVIELPKAREPGPVVVAATPRAEVVAPAKSAEARGAGVEPAEPLLRISALVACRRIEAFGKYVPLDVSSLAAGRSQVMLLYTELEGFAHRTAGGMPPPPGVTRTEDDGQTEWVVHLGQSVEIRRDDGTLVGNYQEQVLREVTRRRRKDFYLVQRVTLPSTLAPGSYTLKAIVRDMATGQVAERMLELKVVRR
jgi:hypothetical protein